MIVPPTPTFLLPNDVIAKLEQYSFLSFQLKHLFSTLSEHLRSDPAPGPESPERSKTGNESFSINKEDPIKRFALKLNNPFGTTTIRPKKPFSMLSRPSLVGKITFPAPAPDVHD